MDKYQEIYALRKTDKDKAYEMAVGYHKKNPRDKYISVAYYSRINNITSKPNDGYPTERSKAMAQPSQAQQS